MSERLAEGIAAYACVLGAYDAAPVQVAGEVAARVPVTQSSLFGTGLRTWLLASDQSDHLD